MASPGPVQSLALPAFTEHSSGQEAGPGTLSGEIRMDMHGVEAGVSGVDVNTQLREDKWPAQRHPGTTVRDGIEMTTGSCSLLQHLLNIRALPEAGPSPRL